MNEYPVMSNAICWVIENSRHAPFDVFKQLNDLGIKTEGYYARVLRRGVRDLYNGTTSEDDLLTTMARLLDEQIPRAWREGMRQNGLDPAEDMTPEWEERIQEIISSEFDHVEQFIADVVAAREAGDPIAPLLSRADLWANRYNDVVNTAKLETAEPKDKFEWVYGDTDHCPTCEALNGLVARAGEWEQAGFHPQQPPNDLLDCGGWRCQCRLEPTDKRRTAGALARLLDIAASRGI